MFRVPIALLLVAFASSVVAQSASDLAAIRAAAHPLTGSFTDYDPLLADIGSAHMVFLGEMTHGTTEFQEERSRITQRLITERNARAVIIEGDFREVTPVDAFVLGAGSDTDLATAFSGFSDFPAWMWRNAQFANFVLWLRQHNRATSAESRVRVVGMDLQNPIASADALQAYLAAVDPAAAGRAAQRYSCFDPYRSDMFTYAAAVYYDPSLRCRQQALDEYQEMQARYDAAPADDALFDALQDARVVMNGEVYFAAEYGGPVSSWVIRDAHFLDTIAAVRARYGTSVSVWTHNSHVANAAATAGTLERNVGQMAREAWGTDAYLVGFSSYTGTVLAAHEWGQQAFVQPLLPARSGSVPAMLHEALPANFYVLSRDSVAARALQVARSSRAIGVVYLPETELQSHYYRTTPAAEFDATIHIDVTRGLDTNLPTFVARRRATAR